MKSGGWFESTGALIVQTVLNDVKSCMSSGRLPVKRRKEPNNGRRSKHTSD
nr:MAG TPA: hypothetical protein [Caudoviricetes sp.]